MTLLPMGFFSQLENALVRHVNSKVKNDFWNTLTSFPRMDFGVWSGGVIGEQHFSMPPQFVLMARPYDLGAGVVNKYINF